MVAKGFNQVIGIDYEETFSLVVRNSTLRFLIALAVEHKMDIDHLDMDTVFLNGEIKEQIYMMQPEGFKVKGQEDKVCLLNKAIYGLKQASRLLNKKVHSVLQEIGYKQSEHEPCVYFKISENKIVVVALYVDDFLIFSNNLEEKIKLKDHFKSKFKIKDLGEAKQCLGLSIGRNKRTGEIFIYQKQYILEILEKFGMINCKPVATPVDQGLKGAEDTSVKIDNVPYQNIIGSLMYLVNTRPNLAFIVSFLTRERSEVPSPI